MNYLSPSDFDATDLRILDQLQTDASQSNQALAEKVHISPPTCLRRVKRLVDAGVVERQICLLNPEKLKAVTGSGLTSIVEVTLVAQTEELLAAFEARIAPEPAVGQCYRVSPGPDFVLIVHTADMQGYHALAQRVFTFDAQVRNVKAFFSVSRSKFEPRLPIF